MGHGGRTLGGSSGVGPEALGESLCGGGGSGDGSQGNAVHSTEALHLHRQMLACKPQEEGGPSTSRATGKAKKKKDTPPLILTFLDFSLFLAFLWADARGPIVVCHFVSQPVTLGRFLRLFTP